LFGFATLYAVTAVACVVAAGLVVLLREVHSPRDAAVAPGFGFETKVLVPGVGMVCLIVTVGFGISLVPLMGAARGLDNPGVYFLAYAAASVLGRFAGRLADRDRLRVIVPGMLLTSVAQLVILQATSTASMIVAGCIAGIGVSVAMPALQALAIDLAPPARRGAAVATITAAADVGVLVGTTTAGILLALVSFGGAFAAAAASPAVGLGVLLLLMRGRASASGDDVHCSTPLKHSPGRRELEGTLNDVL
jgi:MFS family permease